MDEDKSQNLKIKNSFSSRKKIVCTLMMTAVFPIALFAQSNTQNTVPTNGNVGLGTTTPTCKLVVMGHTHLSGGLKVDSSVSISDSAKVGQNLKIGGDVAIGGRLDVNGNTYFNDSIYLMNGVNPADTLPRLITINAKGGLEVSPFKLYVPPNPVSHPCTITVLPFVPSQNLDPYAPPTSVSICPIYYHKVGIGTGNPKAKLDIAAGDTALRVSGDAKGVSVYSLGKGITVHSKDNGLEVYTNEVGNYGYGILSTVYNNTTKAIAVRRDGVSADLFEIYGDGNVGVGTDNPDARLNVFADSSTSFKAISVSTSTQHHSGDVVYTSNNDQFIVYGDGHVFAREFTAMSGKLGYPDYVFKKDYKLMPLGKLEKFVNKNHHLPDIPSQKDIKAQNGIDLGQMEKKLLKKVEELTLYTIQQQKEIDALKAELKK